MRKQIVTPNQIPRLARAMQGWRAIVVDTETSSLDAFAPDTKVLGIGVAPLDEDKHLYVPVQHHQYDLHELDLRPVLDVLEEKPLIGHNIKFDLHQLCRLGLKPKQERFFDTMVMARVWHPAERPALALDALAAELLEYQYETALKSKRRKLTDFSIEDVLAYCLEDVYVTRMLYRWLREHMSDQDLRLFTRETELSRDLFDMEQRGFEVDQDYLAQATERLDEKIKEHLGALRGYASDSDFNPGSPLQVKKFMQTIDIAPVAWSDKTSEPSWNREALLQVRHQHVAAMDLARYRALIYQRDGMIERCIHACNEWGGVMHFDFRNWGTLTGRLSGDSQQMPKGWLQFLEDNDEADEVLVWAEDELAVEKEFSIRRLLRPREGHVLVRPDYKQIEMFALGYYLQDKTFTKWLETEDVHAAAAMDVWRVTPDHPQFQMYRRRGKVYNFGIVYGKGNAAMARDLNCDEEEAKQYRREYFKRMPGYHRFLRKVKATLQEYGLVWNIYGREYHLDPDIAYRGVNYIVQGGSGDFAKFRLPATRALRQELGIHTLNTTHDDFAFEVPIGSAAEKRLPEFIYELGVSPFDRHLELDVEWSPESLVDLRPYKEGMSFAEAA